MRAPPPALTEGPILRSLVRLSVPIILSNLLQTAYQVTDTFWVGRLSQQAVAAVSLSFPINFLLLGLGGGLPIAGTVLIAQYKGRGDEDAMHHVAAQTFLLVFLLSAVLSAAGYLLSEPIMRAMGAGPDVLPDAAAFLRVTFLGFIFVFGFFVFESLLRGLGDARTPMYIVLLTVLLNFVLDPLFIFGWGPVPAMGVSGAAMATFCTQALATVIGIGLLLRGKRGLRLRARDFRPDPAFLRKALAIGLPASVEQSARALGMTLLTALVAGFGTAVVTAYGIGIRILSLVYIPAMGLSVAASALVGQNIGAGKIDRAARTNAVATALAFVVLGALGGLLLVFARPLAVFFVPEGGEAIPLSVTFVRILAPTFGLVGVQMVQSGTLRGAGDTAVPMAVALVTQWILQLPLAYLLARTAGWGPAGIWWSFVAANVLSTGAIAAWVSRGGWKTRRLLEDDRLKADAVTEAEIDQGVAG